MTKTKVLVIGLALATTILAGCGKAEEPAATEELKPNEANTETTITVKESLPTSAPIEASILVK